MGPFGRPDLLTQGGRSRSVPSAGRRERTINDPGSTTDADAVLAANQAFYDAFEAADLDAMSALWEHSERVACTHPGWATLRGWGGIVASWYAIFQNPQRLQFILTEPFAMAEGDVGWVTVNENLLDGQLGSTVAALNVFLRTESGWLMVAHHGSPVMRS
jgi:ketosteroid isomerase-like protein